MSVPESEGSTAFDHPTLPRPATTWYKVFGDLSTHRAPLIVLHGGPGACHECLLPYDDLATTLSIPVVFYDQIGNGRNTHYPEKKDDGDFWTVQLFVDELDNLIEHLHLRDRGFFILGHSWGGMLGASYAIAASRPRGLKRLVLANSPASMALWAEAAQRLCTRLPQDMQEVVERCERDDDYENEAYKAALGYFERRFVCRTEPFPCPELKIAQAQFEADPTTVMTMYGPKAFSVAGSLKDFSTIDGLQRIDVPTLIINGAYDGAQDSCVVPFFRHIRRSKWITLDDASHFSHVEQREKTMAVVGSFLGL